MITSKAKSNVMAPVEQKISHNIKLAIVTKCQCVLQSPESQTSTLRALIKSLESVQILSSTALRRLLLASLCVVFKDILPSYKIRSVTEQEKTQMTKKETRNIRFFEENLLRHYRKYVNIILLILSTSRGRKTRFHSLRKLAGFKWSKADQLSVLRCACQLLEAHPYFNFADELVVAIIPFLNVKISKVLPEIFHTMRSIFSGDMDGNITLSVCRSLHAFCKKRKYLIKPSVIVPMIWIPLLEVSDSPATSTGSMKLLSRREKKKSKLEQKYEKDMANTRAIQSQERRNAVNTLILNEILFVYFKILKTTTDSALLSAVLEGLSCRAKLINLVYVDSLLSLLGRFIDSQLPPIDGLHCVQTALSILSHSSSASVLQTDPTRFCNHLYSSLGRLCGYASETSLQTPNAGRTGQPATTYVPLPSTPAASAVAEHRHRLLITGASGGSRAEASPAGGQWPAPIGRLSQRQAERLTDALLACLELLLVRQRRDISPNRVLAFVKRLASVALSMSYANCTAVILVKLIHLLRLFPRCEVLFDSESEVGGTYRPDCTDPEACLPASACLWELSLLKEHTSPLVRQLSSVAMTWGSTAFLQGATEACLRQPTITPYHGADVLPLDRLIQLSPKECRKRVQAMELLWLQQDAPPPSAKRNDRKRLSTAQPSSWLSCAIAKFKLSHLVVEDNLDHGHYTKRQKMSVG